MKIFICTAGTSIATNRGVDLSPLENQPPQRRNDYQLQIRALTHQVEDFFCCNDLRHQLEQTSAEIHSLAKMGLASGHRVHLLVTDSLDGQICAELNQKYLIQLFDCEVRLEPIPGLQAHSHREFISTGLKNLLTRLIRLLEDYQCQDLIINITAGYKSLAPYLTILGMIYDFPISYLYEKSQEVLTLERLPVRYDESVIWDVQEKLARIDQETDIPKTDWEAGLSFHKLGRYAALIEQSRPGYVTLSGLGLLFYEKFKLDFPPSLTFDPTPPQCKPIHLPSHHGQDILYAFVLRLVQSPYVKGVITSLNYSPHQRDPIKQCYADGRLDLVLVDTEPGYSLQVQTTGRNLKETEQIAALLKQKFF